MPTTTLPAEEVRRIRDLLALTREELASRLDVSPDAIKSWEDGSRNCSGPARLVLLLMQQHPNVLDLLEGDPQTLPRPGAIPNSPEWFKLQRILNLIGPGIDYGYWIDLYQEENFSEDWLLELEAAGLLERSSSNFSIRRISGIGEAKFRTVTWYRWRATLDVEDTRDIPVMTPDLLDRFAKPKTRS